MAPKLPGSTNPGFTTALRLKNITTLNNISTSPTILPDRVLGIKHTCNSKEGIAEIIAIKRNNSSYLAPLIAIRTVVGVSDQDARTKDCLFKYDFPKSI